jgi:hypothetical protein
MHINNSKLLLRLASLSGALSPLAGQADGNAAISNCTARTTRATTKGICSFHFSAWCMALY